MIDSNLPLETALLGVVLENVKHSQCKFINIWVHNDDVSAMLQILDSLVDETHFLFNV